MLQLHVTHLDKKEQNCSGHPQFYSSIALMDTQSPTNIEIDNSENRKIHTIPLTLCTSPLSNYLEPQFNLLLSTEILFNVYFWQAQCSYKFWRSEILFFLVKYFLSKYRIISMASHYLGIWQYKTVFISETASFLQILHWVTYLSRMLFVRDQSLRGQKSINIFKQTAFLTLLGRCSTTPPYQKSALRPSKWSPNDPKFRDFSYFYMTYLKS